MAIATARIINFINFHENIIHLSPSFVCAFAILYYALRHLPEQFGSRKKRIYSTLKNGDVVISDANKPANSPMLRLTYEV